MATPTQGDQLLDLARRMGVVTSRDISDSGIHHQTVTRLVRGGAIERIGRGRYRLPGRETTANHELVEATAAVPRSVVCLISALAFHELGTQLPHRVWLAIDRRRRKPSVEQPTLEIVRFSGAALTEGIETHELEGRPVPIYGIAKTLADVFKYRNKVGLDVALEALDEAWQDRRVTMDEILHYARVCRVDRVMRPYLESLAR